MTDEAHGFVQNVLILYKNVLLRREKKALHRRAFSFMLLAKRKTRREKSETVQ
jgi:hypothetical protein